jgi:hypothetical protein
MTLNSKLISYRLGLGGLCLWGALASLSLLDAIAPVPALAFSIDFDDLETNYRTYTHSPDPDELYAYGESAAVRALSDRDVTTNVELWYVGERVGQSVGFVATNGEHQVRVSSATEDDWDEYRERWIAGLFAKYKPFEQAWASLSDPAQRAFEDTFRHAGLGDPNVTEFSLSPTGTVHLQMAGFYDLRPTLKSRAERYREQQEQVVRLAAAPLPQKQIVATQLGLTVEQLEAKIQDSVTVVEGVTALIQATEQLDEVLQVSEVAKVEVYEGDVLTATEYAYTFEMTESGFTALDDGESYSGLAEWSLETSGTRASGVPEPSFLLGAIATGAIWRAAKRRQQTR